MISLQLNSRTLLLVLVFYNIKYYNSVLSAEALRSMPVVLLSGPFPACRFNSVRDVWDDAHFKNCWTTQNRS